MVGRFLLKATGMWGVWEQASPRARVVTLALVFGCPLVAVAGAALFLVSINRAGTPGVGWWWIAVAAMSVLPILWVWWERRRRLLDNEIHSSLNPNELAAHLNVELRTSYSLEEWVRRSGPGGKMGVAIMVLAIAWLAFLLILVGSALYDQMMIPDPAKSVLLPLWLFLALLIGALSYVAISALVSQRRLHDRLAGA